MRNNAVSTAPRPELRKGYTPQPKIHMGIAAAAQINRVSLKLYWGIGEMLFLYSMLYLPLFLEFCLGNFLPSVFELGNERR